MTQEFQWVEETKRLTDLKPFEYNPRTITESQFEKLKASLIEFGQFKPVLVTQDYRLAGGHQRIKAMTELGWETCRVSVPQYPITDEQYLKLIVIDNVNNGAFDMDVLANLYDVEDLREWGVHEIMNLPPMFGEDNPEPEQNEGTQVRCPNCQAIFPSKGNKA